MTQMLPKTIKVGDFPNGHVQGIAIDKERKYIYLSFTTCLVKADLEGNVVGMVSGLAGHLGCIAYNYEDGKVYGSLEYKNDIVGGYVRILSGHTKDLTDAFYIAKFDVEKIDRMDMDAEKDGVMTAVYLKEVVDDYSAEGHRYGCSGIDGTTFAPAFGSEGGKNYLYVSYGVYGQIEREDNDYQVILKYDISDWENYAKPLNQDDMHHFGPAKPDEKYFLYTGNTTYGVQNLEYDPASDMILAAVYTGKKEQFPNYPMFFIDHKKAPETVMLKGLNESGECISLAEIGLCDEKTGIRGSDFPHGSTGIISLGDGLFYFSEHYRNEKMYGTVIRLYRFDAEKGEFAAV